MAAQQAPRPIEQIADGLQRLIAETAETAAEKAVARLEPRLDRMDARLDRQDETIASMREHMDTRLDRQDETLRMVWKQVKGNGKLPIDD